MIIKNVGEYNPKIDFVACKYIVMDCNLIKYNEHRYKACFHGKLLPRASLEKDMLRVKTFLLNIDINNIRIEDIVKLYQEVANEKIDDILTDIEYLMNNVEDVDLSISYIVKLIISRKLFINKQKLMIKLIMNVMYLKYKNFLLIPYYNTYERLIVLIKYTTNYRQIKSLLNQLYQRTKDLNRKHEEDYHKYVYEIVEKQKDEFINKFNLEKFGVYGSFATNTMTEYSDIDMLAVTKETCDLRMLETVILDYWRDYILIPIDIKVVNSKEIKQKLTMAMKKNLRYIGEKSEKSN